MTATHQNLEEFSFDLLQAYFVLDPKRKEFWEKEFETDNLFSLIYALLKDGFFTPDSQEDIEKDEENDELFKNGKINLENYQKMLTQRRERHRFPKSSLNEKKLLFERLTDMVPGLLSLIYLQLPLHLQSDFCVLFDPSPFETVKEWVIQSPKVFSTRLKDFLTIFYDRIDLPPDFKRETPPSFFDMPDENSREAETHEFQTFLNLFPPFFEKFIPLYTNYLLLTEKVAPLPSWQKTDLKKIHDKTFLKHMLEKVDHNPYYHDKELHEKRILMKNNYTHDLITPLLKARTHSKFLNAMGWLQKDEIIWEIESKHNVDEIWWGCLNFLTHRFILMTQYFRSKKEQSYFNQLMEFFFFPEDLQKQKTFDYGEVFFSFKNLIENEILPKTHFLP